MPTTNFPNGLTSYGVPVFGSGNMITTGNVFFVDSGSGTDANGHGATSDRPFASIDFAIGKCTANNGDYIIVLPGHTETVTAAAGLDFDVAGVTCIGVGYGADRPTINLTTATTADIDIAAANTRLVNFLITGGVDALAAVIHVTASDILLQDIECRDVTGQTVRWIHLDGTSAISRIHITGLNVRGAAAAGGAEALGIDDTTDLLLEDFFIDGNWSVGAVNFITDASTDAIIRNGYIRERNSADLAVIDTITGSSGIMGPNLVLHLADDAANITEAITGATFFVVDQGVTVMNAANQKSLAINWTAAADS